MSHIQSEAPGSYSGCLYNNNNNNIIIILSGVRLSPLGSAATTGLLHQPQMIDDGDCGAIGGMKIGRENRSTRRKPVSVPLGPPKFHMT
jgi:hypothetical protein